MFTNSFWRLKKYLFSVFISMSFIAPVWASSLSVSPEDVLSAKQQANYFENRLGVIAVGETPLEILERYIGIGEKIAKKRGEKVYYVDPKNKRTLIVDVNSQGLIEVVNYKSYIELPPGVDDIDKIKISDKLNIKNLMTSMGSRIGYNYSRIVGAYGRPSVEVTEKGNRELKYIKLGSLNSKHDFVYLEYSFRLKNNQVVEIRIENGK